MNSLLNTSALNALTNNQSQIVQISTIQMRSGREFELPGQPSNPNDFLTLTKGLEVAEIGFTIDSGRLFIGPEDYYANTWERTEFPYRNIEILTEFSPNIEKILKYTYSYKAGDQILSTPELNGRLIYRTLADKLNDFVSVKDYGAIGDGLNDDTEALVQAIMDVATTARSNPNIGADRPRRLFFPSGVYRITRTIPLPTHSNWFGEGPDSTIILLEGTDRHIVQSIAEPIGVADFNNLTEFTNKLTVGIGESSLVDFGILKSINIKDIGFKRTENGSGLAIYRTYGGNIENCKFVGAWPCQTNSIFAVNSKEFQAIELRDLNYLIGCKNISIRNCYFTKWQNISAISENVFDIEYSNCVFEYCGKGISINPWPTSVNEISLNGTFPFLVDVGFSEQIELFDNDIVVLANQSNLAENGIYRVISDGLGNFNLTTFNGNTPTDINILECRFDKISAQGIYVGPATTAVMQNIKSLGNTYYDVGDGLDDNCLSSGPLCAVIEWNDLSNGNTSANDVFNRLGATNIPRVKKGAGLLHKISNIQDEVYSPQLTPPRYTLLPNTLFPASAQIKFSLLEANSFFLKYTLRGDSLNDFSEIGTITLQTINNIVSFNQNTISTIGSNPIVLSAQIVGSNIEILYTNSSPNSSVAIYIESNSWNNVF
jgi:hypothetical protein